MHEARRAATDEIGETRGQAPQRGQWEDAALVKLLTGHSPDGFPGLVVGGPDEKRSCLT
jgi:hypothetical protein